MQLVKQHKNMLMIGFLFIIVVVAYLFLWMFTHTYDSISTDVFVRILSRRSIHLIAMMVSAILVVLSSLIFQTMTHNRILTPSILGFDSIFIATQTMIVFVLGSTSSLISNPFINFGLSSITMAVISVSLYQSMLKKFNNNLALMLLFGIVIATLLRSMVSFIQTIMNPDEFQSVAAATTVTITSINTQLVIYVLPIMLVIIASYVYLKKQYDVMALGRNHAVGLGLNYDKLQRISLILISLSLAVSTALVGPLSFLGLMAVNASKEFTHSFKHGLLMIVSSMIGIIFLIGGQLLVEQTGFITSVTVFISLFGGLYILFLILKENTL